FTRTVPVATDALSLHDALPIYGFGVVGEHRADHRQRSGELHPGPHPGVGELVGRLPDALPDLAAGGRAAVQVEDRRADLPDHGLDRKSTRLNSSHVKISYAVFC